MSSTPYPATRIPGSNVLAWTIGTLFRPLHGLIVAPSLLFLATLALMLFHPPDFNFHSVDRVAFGLLIFVVLLRVCALRNPLQFRSLVTCPMLALVLLAFYGVVSQPSDVETWSLFAAKWLVPFTLYQLAAYIFDDERSLLRFETFSLVVLAYLSLTAIFFMADAKQLIFPRYILDESLGYHAERARGPFLQGIQLNENAQREYLLAIHRNHVNVFRPQTRTAAALFYFIKIVLINVAGRCGVALYPANRFGTGHE